MYYVLLSTKCCAGFKFSIFDIFFISQTNANCCLKNIHNISIHVDNHYIKSEYKVICVYIRVHIWSFVNLATPHKGNNSVYLSLPTLFQQLKYLIYVSLVIDILLFSASGTLFICLLSQQVLANLSKR